MALGLKQIAQPRTGLAVVSDNTSRVTFSVFPKFEIVVLARPGAAPVVDSIREKIMANIKTVLETITTGNGYNNTIASVQRWSQHDQVYASLPMIIFVAAEETCKDEPNPLTTCTLTVEGLLYTSQEPGSGTATDTFLNTFYEDIKKALKVDISRGGNAIDTRITEIEPFETAEDEPHAGLVLDIEVDYRYLETDPGVGG